MRSTIRDFRRDQSGQGLMEYALMLFLVALVVFAAIRALGPKTSNMVTEASQVFETRSSDGTATPADPGKPGTPPGKPADPGKPGKPGKP
jgi:Flp pilus assembly pilin Flp